MSDNHLSLEKLWMDLEAAGIPWGSALASELGEVSKYVSLNATLQRSLLIQGKLKPPHYPKFDSVRVTSSQTESGEWFLVLELQDSEHKQEFTQLCVDMLQETVGVSDEQHTHELMHKAYSDWLDFYRSSKKLSIEVARGLFGELWFLKTFAEQEYGRSQALLSWVGPLGSAQDFVFPDFKAFEVKTQQPSSDLVKISSVNQLEYDGSLFLVKYRIANSNSPNFGKSLANLVQEMRKSLLENSEVKDFDNKLSMLDLNLDDPNATEIYFSLEGPKFYSASLPGFPKLSSTDIPEGVRKTTYEVYIPSLIPFEVVKP
jgi:hypothetical protein